MGPPLHSWDTQAGRTCHLKGRGGWRGFAHVEKTQEEPSDPRAEKQPCCWAEQPIQDTVHQHLQPIHSEYFGCFQGHLKTLQIINMM